VAANGGHYGWALRTQRSNRPHRGVQNDRPMQNVGETSARVANVEAQVIGDRHVLNSAVEALAGVPGLQAPRRSDGPVCARYVLVLQHRLEVRVDSGITRVGLGCTEVHVLDEPAHSHAWRWAGRRTAAAEGERRRDLGEISIVHGIHAV